MPYATCLHPSNKRTLVLLDGVDVGCCAKCFRRWRDDPAPVCHGCGSVPDEYRTRAQLGLRDINGKPHCKRCRERLRRGDAL